MGANCPIHFKTTRTSGSLGEGRLLYQGQLLHNEVLSVAETRRLFANYAESREPLSNLYLDMLGAFIRDYLAKGYRLNFGAFSAGLKLNGSFPASNAAFDPEVNSIGVELTPSAGLKAAVANLKPVNVTARAKSRLYCNYQLSPYSAYDEIAADGTRVVQTQGEQVKVTSGGEGEGVWIENDIGERLLTGVVTESDASQTVSTFTGPIAAGLYWLVVASRPLGGGELLRACRRITVR